MSLLRYIPVPQSLSLPSLRSIDDSDTAQALDKIKKSVNYIAQYLANRVTPSGLTDPTGPFGVLYATTGGTVNIQWQADTSGPFVLTYRVYRLASGTRTSPTTPGPDNSKCVAVIPANNRADGGFYRYADRDFAITEFDPANPTRYSYWVTAVDDRARESQFVQAAIAPSNNLATIGVPTPGPIELLTSGPGDQSPELKFTVLNKLPFTSFLASVATNIDQPFAITASTNATPIVVTIGAHTFAVGDRVAIDQHAVNTNANGWWVVSAIAATTITLQGSIGNGIGAVSGNAYRHPKALGGFPPTRTPDTPVVNGCTGDFTHGYGANNLVKYTSWWSGNANLPIVFAGGLIPNVIEMPGGLGISSSINVELSETLFNSGRATFSVIARWKTNPAPPNSALKLELLDDTGASSRLTTFAGSLINDSTGTFKKFVFNFGMPGLPGTPGKRFRFNVANLTLSGTGMPMYICFPMVSLGDVTPVWTEVVDTSECFALGLAGATPLTSAWQRPLSQVLARDTSAPYS